MTKPTMAIGGRKAIVTSLSLAFAGILTSFVPALALTPEYMTILPVCHGRDGKQYFSEGSKAWLLNGPGCDGDRVSIYHGFGRRWYFDRNAHPVMLPQEIRECRLSEVAPAWHAPSWPIPAGAPIYFPESGPAYYSWQGKRYGINKMNPFYNHLSEWHSPQYWHYEKEWANHEGVIETGHGDRDGFKHYFGEAEHHGGLGPGPRNEEKREVHEFNKEQHELGKGFKHDEHREVQAFNKHEHEEGKQFHREENREQHAFNMREHEDAKRAHNEEKREVHNFNMKQLEVAHPRAAAAIEHREHAAAERHEHAAAEPHEHAAVERHEEQHAAVERHEEHRPVERHEVNHAESHGHHR